MTSVTQSSAVPDPVRDAAARLAPGSLRAVDELRKGANNRIFRVKTTSGDFALKKYPTSDTRDRQGAEARALAFFARAGIREVPALIAADRAAQISLLSWVEGSSVDALDDDDVRQFTDFHIALDAALDDLARAEVGEASEACLSGRRIMSHITTRLARFAAVKHDVPGFARFLDESLYPKLAAFERSARATYARLGLDFEADLPMERRTLIASDFGAHNALRCADRRLTFVDFEYFGWDDPLTSIGNFVLHPGMRLSKIQQALYAERILARLGPVEAHRLKALLPLFAVRWCTIILGELLPERWRHRVEANAVTADGGEVRRAQLDKAIRLLAAFSPPEGRDRA